ncbi:MAG: head GIN domain-containing protein [bacterium]
MKTKVMKGILLFSVALTLFTGCIDLNINEPDHHIHGSGRIVSETRSVSECYGLILRYTGNVYLTQDDHQYIRVEADDNIIEDVIARKSDGNLVVGLQDGSYDDVTVRIYVSLKTIDLISIDGAGDISVQNFIESDDLDCTISGAGNIYLKGNGENLYCGINGSGNIDAFDFTTEECTARVHGAGNIYVNVSDYLDASISGVGNIVYGGDPEVKSQITGIGNIYKR